MLTPLRLFHRSVHDLLDAAIAPKSWLTSSGIGAASPEDVLLSVFGLATY